MQVAGLSILLVLGLATIIYNFGIFTIFKLNQRRQERRDSQIVGVSDVVQNTVPSEVNLRQMLDNM